MYIFCLDTTIPPPFLNIDDVEEEFCKEAFVEDSGASCILYDDEKCDGSEGVKELTNGALLLTDTTALDFDVESISIKKGCQLSVYSGK